jgi:hypothetical protein
VCGRWRCWAARGHSSCSQGARRSGRQKTLGVGSKEAEAQSQCNIGLGPLIQGPWPICTVSAHLNTVQVSSLAAGAHPLCLILAPPAGKTMSLLLGDALRRG